ncbi:hypothetical protein C1S80_28605 [Mycolicibacterium aubagnense]|nr:hypothetical protein C1S80_28605 [Mycolicibacterium aubagnense]
MTTPSNVGAGAGVIAAAGSAFAVVVGLEIAETAASFDSGCATGTTALAIFADMEAGASLVGGSGECRSASVVVRGVSSRGGGGTVLGGRGTVFLPDRDTSAGVDIASTATGAVDRSSRSVGSAGFDSDFVADRTAELCARRSCLSFTLVGAYRLG